MYDSHFNKKKILVDLMYISSGHRTQDEPCNKPRLTGQCSQTNGAQDRYDRLVSLTVVPADTKTGHYIK